VTCLPTVVVTLTRREVAAIFGGMPTSICTGDHVFVGMNENIVTVLTKFVTVQTKAVGGRPYV
jgi:hypothetical protein